ncbi:GM22979, partial [Drosophila sechellia]
LPYPRTRSRTRLSVDSEAASSRPGTPTTTKARGKRAVSQAPVTAKPSVRSLRGQSEPPSALSAQVVRKPKAARAVVSLRKMSSDAPIDAPIDVPDSTAPEELPRVRRTTRRRISELSDQSGTATGDSRSEASSCATNSTASSQNREIRPRLRRTSKSEH